MKIQLDIPEPINQAMKIEKAQRNVASLKDLILFILQDRYIREGEQDD